MIGSDDRDRFVSDERDRSAFHRIPLAHLSFKRSRAEWGHRPLREDLVARLLRRFRQEGCRRLESNNFIHGIRNPADGALVVHAIDGLHRIEAARRFFTDPEDCWWPVKLHEGGE